MVGGRQRRRIALGLGIVLSVPALLATLGTMDRPTMLRSVRPAFATDKEVATKAPMAPESAPGADTGGDSIASDSGADEIASSDSSSPAAQLPCSVSGRPLGYGSFGDDVLCLQAALAEVGFFDGSPNGLYDDATFGAVVNYQTVLGLEADGLVGRETGLFLGIWPLDPFTVERTPVPPPGATDLWGLPLSSVATSGPDAPALPPNSGSGYRLVYDRAAQRIWAVDDNETVIRSWLVSGSRSDNEIPGTHKVYSRSRSSISRDGDSRFEYMVRWLRVGKDAIGFHSLPRRTVDDSPYQTENELGIKLSSGCQRQADLDAQFTWQFAPIGTTVVVL